MLIKAFFNFNLSLKPFLSLVTSLITAMLNILIPCVSATLFKLSLHVAPFIEINCDIVNFESICSIMFLNGSSKFKIISNYVIYLVPGDYPPNLAAVKKSSNSVQLTWDALSGDAKKHGNITGYTVKYRIRGSQTWLYVKSTSQNRMFDSLKMYAVYEFSVAASTSKGVGVYSPVVGEMTGEDGKPPFLGDLSPLDN